MIIGLVGFIGVGKSTVSEMLYDEHGFKAFAFADTLKDVVSTMFGWNRELIEGDTKASREFRDTVDPWWTDRLGFNVTPRLALQLVGTDACRAGVSDKIWITCLERKISTHLSENLVITDCRFKNEIDMVRRLGGKIVWVKRGPYPTSDELNMMHISSKEWATEPVDYALNNDGTREELSDSVTEMLTKLDKTSIIFHHQV
jgi:hypothetical protein